jgi:hypothetical protein
MQGDLLSPPAVHPSSHGSAYSNIRSIKAPADADTVDSVQFCPTVVDLPQVRFARERGLESLIKYGPRDSRCLYIENAPQPIHWAVIPGEPAVKVAVELIGVVRSIVPRAAQVDAGADVIAMLERYSRCVAVDPEDVVPVAQDPRLWEFRLDLTTYGLLLRIYETEIDEVPGHLIALRAHHKIVVDGDDDETKSLQDAEIGVASARWDDGRPTFWGL